MNTGAGSALPGRGPRAYRSGVKFAIAASLCPGRLARERLQRLQQRMAAAPQGEGPGVLAHA
jgi:hypothetical protein